MPLKDESLLVFSLTCVYQHDSDLFYNEEYFSYKEKIYIIDFKTNQFLHPHILYNILPQMG